MCHRTLPIACAVFCMSFVLLALTSAPDALAQDKKDDKVEKVTAEDFEKFMKAVGKERLKVKKAIKSKDKKNLAESAKKIKDSASKASDNDPDEKRKDADDYKKWSKDFIKQSKELEKLSKANKLDWDKIGEQFETLDGTCDACHDKYDDDDE